MRFPIDGAFRIGYGFGPRGDIGVPGASEDHEGIDIARPNGPLPRGTPIHAILPGRILEARNSGGAGGYTTLSEHPYKGGLIRARINHYSRWDVRAGQTVPEGHVLGLSGGQPGLPGAGSSGGGHCHVGIYKVINGRTVAIDPGPFFGLGSTLGIGTTRPAVTFPAFAGGGATPLEEDDMTPEQAKQFKTMAARVDAVYAAMFGARNITDKPDPIKWQNISGVQETSNYGVMSIIIEDQRRASAQAGQIAALTELVEQLGGGDGTVDMAAIEAAAERGAREALSGLTLKAVED